MKPMPWVDYDQSQEIEIASHAVKVCSASEQEPHIEGQLLGI